MSVEIRELVIKTEVKTQSQVPQESFNREDVESLKQQLMNECMRIFKEKTQKNSFNR